MKLRLRDIREDRDFTQAQLAHYLNCRQQTYSRYENGKAQPSLEVMEKLAAFFGTSVDYLMGLTDDTTPHASSTRSAE